MLIPDVPDDVLAAIDARAGELGLSRSEYLRRMLTRAASREPAAQPTVAHLHRFESLFAELADEELMRHAWR